MVLVVIFYHSANSIHQIFTVSEIEFVYKAHVGDFCDPEIAAELVTEPLAFQDIQVIAFAYNRKQIIMLLVYEDRGDMPIFVTFQSKTPDFSGPWVISVVTYSFIAFPFDIDKLCDYNPFIIAASVNESSVLFAIRPTRQLRVIFEPLMRFVNNHIVNSIAMQHDTPWRGILFKSAAFGHCITAHESIHEHILFLGFLRVHLFRFHNPFVHHLFENISLLRMIY